MNAITPFLDPQSFASPAPFAMKMAMGNNVGRDILSRATEFLKSETAIFEYVANAYESYDHGMLPEIDVTVECGKNGYVTVVDKGCGMEVEDLVRFWSMHAKTLRREKGLNRRGYHGTGKIAFVAIARSLRVETVKDGLLNITVLTRENIEKAAETGGQVDVNVITRDEPTDRPDGTKVTIGKLNRSLTVEDVRLLRAKIALELMLFMKGGQVSVNGQKVEANSVTGEETVEYSDCGNFSIRIVRNDCGHHEDLQYVFYSCDGVFIAREQTGKEGHRFAHRVYASVDTTHEWAERHFHNHREQFVSEARDLRLKVAEPAPRALRDFAEARIRAFMKRLEDEDEERREKEKSEKRKKLEKELSRVFSAFYTGGAGAARRGGGVKTGNIETVEKESSARTRAKEAKDPRGPQGKLKFDFKDYAETDSPFVIEEQILTVNYNTASPFIKSLSQQEDHPARRQALYDLAAEAVAQIEARQAVSKAFEGKELEEPMMVADAVIKEQARILAAIKNDLCGSYAAFHIASTAD